MGFNWNELKKYMHTVGDWEGVIIIYVFYSFKTENISNLNVHVRQITK